MKIHFLLQVSPRLLCIACAAALPLGGAAYGQAPAEIPPAAQPTVPAEIQPGHAPKGNALPDAPNSDPAPSPSTPSPQPGGVIRPPHVGDTGVKPPPRSFDSTAPVIQAPGSPGGNQNVVPK